MLRYNRIYEDLPVGFPSGLAVKNPPAMQELQEKRVESLGGEDPLEEGMATHSSILAWRISDMTQADFMQACESFSDPL